MLSFQNQPHASKIAVHKWNTFAKSDQFLLCGFNVNSCHFTSVKLDIVCLQHYEEVHRKCTKVFDLIIY